jgi:hypothetical protein
MSVSSIIVLGLSAIVPIGSVNPVDMSAEAMEQSTVQIAAASDCCRRWDSRSKRWLVVGTDKNQCIKLNQRFDRHESTSRIDFTSQKGTIWWDHRCDNNPDRTQ